MDTQQNNPWMNFHLNASEYADSVVFGRDESPIIPNRTDPRFNSWLKCYDDRMTQLQNQFTNYQLNRGTRH